MSDFCQRYPWVLTLNGQTVARFKYRSDAHALLRERAAAKGDAIGLHTTYAPWPLAGVEEPVSRQANLKGTGVQ